MRLYYVPAVAGILATIALIMTLMDRRTGFASIGTAVVGSLLYAAGWICTFVVLIVLLKNGAFQWLSGIGAIRVSVVLLLHAAIGYGCLRGIIEFTNSGMHWWGWPCLTLATVIPLAVNLAVFVRK